MDPVAHTLVGAALAESGLKHRSRYATATLLIGANLPDIDAIAKVWGRDVEMHVRRGWTHGILALVVLPLVLAGAIWLWNRWRSRASSGAEAAAFRPLPIVALSFLAVWTHPALDWLNTYGVRLLMPFDGRWFYGDTLFIIDPWVWLLAGAGVVAGWSRSGRGIAAWILAAALATGLVLGAQGVATGVKVAWLAGILAIVALRWRHAECSALVARSGLAALLLHIGIAYALARAAESVLAGRFAAATQVQANPVPGIPFAHRLVVVQEDRYVVVTKDGVVHELPRRPADAVVTAALQSPSIRGFANWMRFPYWQVEERGDRWIVRIQDLRYQGPDLPDARGIGFVEVEVPK